MINDVRSAQLVQRLRLPRPSPSSPNSRMTSLLRSASIVILCITVTDDIAYCVADKHKMPTALLSRSSARPCVGRTLRGSTSFVPRRGVPS